MVHQKEIQLPAFRRGYHLITHLINEELGDMPENGVMQIFIKHTSAGLTINENADPTVRDDFESYFDQLVPENEPYYKHTMEGSDDMPAHLKASIIGHSVSIPVSKGRLNLGTWQGIYLCEFRNRGGSRRLVLTMIS